jgi:hypothetical protein
MDLQDIIDARNGVSNLIKAVRDITSKNAQSLPERAQAASAVSRVYVASGIADEDIMLPLVGTLNQLYVAYIMTVLGMESIIDGGKTVADITRLVSSENLVDPVMLADAAFSGKVSASVENVSEDILERIEEIWNEPGTKTSGGSSTKLTDSKVVGLDDKELHLVAGRVVEVGITGAGGKTIPLRVYAQLVPRIVDDEVAGAFVGLNAKSPALRRLRRAKVGEIKFWKDFVFSLDRIAKVRSALKKDKTGDLQNMIEHQDSSLLKHWMSMARVANNYNSASSVMIIGKDQFQKELASNGVSFDASTQAKFFKTSLMMMLAVVSTDYNTIELYTNGIKGKGEYSFDAIEKVGSAKTGGMDVKDVMTMFGRGNNARF